MHWSWDWAPFQRAVSANLLAPGVSPLFRTQGSRRSSSRHGGTATSYLPSPHTRKPANQPTRFTDRPYLNIGTGSQGAGSRHGHNNAGFRDPDWPGKATGGGFFG
ncbi:hypothetical protein LX32DRAFT_645540 [Colletotrichum zoysiae]|uniref:Uncharacterized protein n=1 Tax=Colletotrichum zoysiae TaxID=1216348 RepID=A0AAD9H6R2_9PEZI|nr:hypothetical protein LX32DRAFT_645540 [Colletotrichum zoysiae]